MANVTPAGNVQEDQSMEEILQSIRRIIAEEEDASTSEIKGSDVLELTDMVAEDGSVTHLEAEKPVNGKHDDFAAADSAKVEAPVDDVLSNIDQMLAADKPAKAEEEVSPASVPDDFGMVEDEAPFETAPQPAAAKPEPEPEFEPVPAAQMIAEEAPAEPEVMVDPEPEPEPAYQPEPMDAAAEEDDDEDSLISEAAILASVQALSQLKRSPAPRQEISESPQFRNGQTVEDLVLESLRPMLKSWLDANLPTLVQQIVEREVRRLTRD